MCRINEFTPLPCGGSWKSPRLFCLKVARDTVEARFGQAHWTDLDSNGIGLFDEWMMRFDCGLEVSLWIFQTRWPWQDQMSPLRSAEVYANQCDVDHIMAHLALPHAELWRDAPPLPARFRVLRLDDNGGTFEVTRTTSECQAQAVMHQYEARGHKQMYWVEPLNDVAR